MIRTLKVFIVNNIVHKDMAIIWELLLNIYDLLLEQNNNTSIKIIVLSFL